MLFYVTYPGSHSIIARNSRQTLYLKILTLTYTSIGQDIWIFFFLISSIPNVGLELMTLRHRGA